MYLTCSMMFKFIEAKFFDLFAPIKSAMVVVYERCLLDDALFWNVVSDLFGANKYQKASYEVVWRECCKNVKRCLPDVFVYLKTPKETCVERQVHRGRKEEEGVTTPDYLRRVFDAHQKLFIENVGEWTLCDGFQHGVFQSTDDWPEFKMFLKYVKSKPVFVIENNDLQTLSTVIEHIRGIKGNDAHICMSGCIAAGKSTALKRISKLSGCEVVPEPLAAWSTDSVNLLSAFNQFPFQAAFEFQMAAFISRAFCHYSKNA